MGTSDQPDVIADFLSGDGHDRWDEGTIYASGVVPWRFARPSMLPGSKATGSKVNGSSGKTDTDEFEVLLIHRPRYNDWSVPKGKRDPGESDEQCAVREMHEETGILGDLGEPLPTVLYTDHKGRPKEVAYWLMRVDCEDPSNDSASAFVPNDEVDKVRWFTLSKAREKLTYPIDKALLDEASLVLEETHPS